MRKHVTTFTFCFVLVEHFMKVKELQLLGIPELAMIQFYLWIHHDNRLRVVLSIHMRWHFSQHMLQHTVQCTSPTATKTTKHTHATTMGSSYVCMKSLKWIQFTVAYNCSLKVYASQLSAYPNHSQFLLSLALPLCVSISGCSTLTHMHAHSFSLSIALPLIF